MVELMRGGKAGPLSELDNIRFALDQACIVAITDSRGVITFVNDKFCEISQYHREELVGKDHRIINSGYHDKAFFKTLWGTILAGQVWNGEIRNRSKDGSIYWVETTIVPFLGVDGIPSKFVSIRKDISERKAMAEQLDAQRLQAVYSEKMAALGEMAAGIAHEIGNPLGSLRGRLEILAESALAGRLDSAQTVEMSERLIGMVDRVSRIVRGMKAYSRNASGDPLEVVRIRDLIDDIMSFSDSKLKNAAVQLRVRMSDDNIRLRCREAEIGQVLLSLINNACFAIRNLKERWIDIEVSTQTCPLDLGGPGDMVIRVTDSGKGILEDTAKKMFVPFFTTKPIGQGTGLGLSICRKITDSHQGTISYDKNHAHTSFVITLPGVVSL